MLYVLAFCNFNISLFFPDSGFAGFNVAVGWLLLGLGARGTYCEVAEIVRKCRN